MKIGILTFHWGTNYGGVLQAYALQWFLQRKGADVEIINYAPKNFRNSIFLCLKTRRLSLLKRNISEYVKEKKFSSFRKKVFSLSKRFCNPDSVKDFINNYDVIVVGSDQVWNPIIMNEEGRPYWLPATGRARKIAYAISLGCTHYSEEDRQRIAPWVREFCGIGLRENTGVAEISHIIGKSLIDVKLTLDPTLLAGSTPFEQFLKKNATGKSVFVYVLQQKQKKIEEEVACLQEKGFCINNAHSGFCRDLSVEEWLNGVYNSEFVVTNSYHGVAFSVLFRKKFVVFPVEGRHSTMNDRIETLLSRIGLLDRVYRDDQSVAELLNCPIDWPNVEKNVKLFAKESSVFLERFISYEV